jgi:hypothetical protein
MANGRFRRAAAFCMPEAAPARAPHARLIDTCNHRIVLLRID